MGKKERKRKETTLKDENLVVKGQEEVFNMWNRKLEHEKQNV